MIDHQPSARIDLRALDEPHDPNQADRVVSSVLRRAAIDELLEPADLLVRLGAFVRPALAVAAIVILCAIATLRSPGTRGAGMPLVSLSSWASAERVPTNGELLSAFKGYGK